MWPSYYEYIHHYRERFPQVHNYTKPVFSCCVNLLSRRYLEDRNVKIHTGAKVKQTRLSETLLELFGCCAPSPNNPFICHCLDPSPLLFSLA